MPIGRPWQDVRAALRRVEGTYALVAISDRDPEHIVMGEDGGMGEILAESLKKQQEAARRNLSDPRVAVSATFAHLLPAGTPSRSW